MVKKEMTVVMVVLVLMENVEIEVNKEQEVTMVQMGLMECQV